MGRKKGIKAPLEKARNIASYGINIEWLATHPSADTDKAWKKHPLRKD